MESFCFFDPLGVDQAGVEEEESAVGNAGKDLNYHHTQRAPLCLLVYAVGIIFIVLGFVIQGAPPIRFMFPPIGILILVLGASFHHLTLADEGDRLAIRFGPLPFFRTRVPYEDIQNVEVGKTTLLDGWGIHMSLRGGWVWNLWGWNCVVLQLRKGTLRVGTDDAENLAQFLKGRIANRNDED